MGILVMATLHTNGSAATVDRIVNAFPADKQNHVRTMLSTSLRGVVSQQLISRKGTPGRVAALEVLINTPAAANLIRQGKIDQLETVMQSGADAGMRTMDSAIEQLLDQGLISGRSAYEKSINKTKFEPLKTGLTAARATPRRRRRVRHNPRLISGPEPCPAASSSPAPCPTPTGRRTSVT